MNSLARDTHGDHAIGEAHPPVLERPTPRWRVVTANWLSLIALAHLVAGLCGIAFLYWYAAQKGLPLSPNHEIYSGGPWAYEYELETGVRLLLDAPLKTFFFAVLSMCFKPTFRAAMVFSLSLLLGMAAIWMIGLVDD